MRPFQKSGFVARISSRITTVIRVADTIKQTITDLMSHSQFHSLNWFILTHAWLNLWDKHMTTGRINQVAFLWVAAYACPADTTSRQDNTNATIIQTDVGNDRRTICPTTLAWFSESERTCSHRAPLQAWFFNQALAGHETYYVVCLETREPASQKGQRHVTSRSIFGSQHRNRHRCAIVKGQDRQIWGGIAGW